jgi:hypothetical protein
VQNGLFSTQAYPPDGTCPAYIITYEDFRRFFLDWLFWAGIIIMKAFIADSESIERKTRRKNPSYPTIEPSAREGCVEG